MPKSPTNLHLQPMPLSTPIDVGRVSYLLDYCRDKRVLHLGCVDEGLTRERLAAGVLLHQRLLEVTRELVGVDNNKEGIQLLRDSGIDGLFLGDAEHLDQLEAISAKCFDVILVPEVIEHLDNPGLFLQSVHSLFGTDTVMILSAPNAYRLTNVLYLLQGIEPVHPDHNYWYSWSTLKTLLAKNNFEVRECRAYSSIDYRKSPVAALFALPQKSFPGQEQVVSPCPTDSTKKRLSVTGKVFRRIRHVTKLIIYRYFFRKNPFFADGIIFVVTPGKTS